MKSYIDIMNDRQTKIRAGSEQLERLLEVATFFTTWKSDIERKWPGAHCARLRHNLFFSDECYEDLQTSIHGFVGCVRHYVVGAEAWTVARRWSQDKLENMFSYYREHTFELTQDNVSTKSIGLTALKSARLSKVSKPEARRRRSYEEVGEADGKESGTGTDHCTGEGGELNTPEGPSFTLYLGELRSRKRAREAAWSALPNPVVGEGDEWHIRFQEPS